MDNLNSTPVLKARLSIQRQSGTSKVGDTNDNQMLDVSTKPLFIGVTGGTAGGKTTVCDIIAKEFETMCSIVTFDNFYKGLTKSEHEDADNYNFDSPNALDFDLCYEKLKQLLQYKDIDIPIYDFATHKRVEGEMTHVKAQPIIIFEGIMSMYESRFRDLMDLKIFVMTDDDVRLARRVKRDIEERGRSIEQVLAQYNRFVKGSYDTYIKPVLKFADIIVPYGRQNTIAIDFIISNLKARMPTKQMLEAENQDINNVPFNQDQFILKSLDQISEEGKQKSAQIETMIQKLNKNEDEILHSVFKDSIVSNLIELQENKPKEYNADITFFVTQSSLKYCIDELLKQLGQRTEELLVFVINQDEQLIEKIKKMVEGQFYTVVKVYTLDQKEILNVDIDQTIFRKVYEK